MVIKNEQVDVHSILLCNHILKAISLPVLSFLHCILLSTDQMFSDLDIIKKVLSSSCKKLNSLLGAKTTASVGYMYSYTVYSHILQKAKERETDRQIDREEAAEAYN